MTGFKPYRRKGGDIQAQPVDVNMTIPKVGGGTIDLVPGDYLVLAAGELDGAKKAEFEEAFEPVRGSGKVVDPNKPHKTLTEEQKAAKAATRAANKAKKEAEAQAAGQVASAVS